MCKGFVRGSYGMCKGFVGDLYGTPVEFVWDSYGGLYGVPMAFVRDSHGICMGFPWDLYGIGSAILKGTATFPQSKQGLLQCQTQPRQQFSLLAALGLLLAFSLASYLCQHPFWSLLASKSGYHSCEGI